MYKPEQGDMNPEQRLFILEHWPRVPAVLRIIVDGDCIWTVIRGTKEDAYAVYGLEAAYGRKFPDSTTEYRLTNLTDYKGATLEMLELSGEVIYERAEPAA